ncbi:MAG: FAD-dependent oxidoreductase, partial [Rhodobiaceae bacterium]|nr:FAD-dependent oxidoreductase [Rhodobiaceae bacterium]
DKALIGTTDIPHEGSPDDVAIAEDEIDYLIRAVNRYFNHQIKRGDVLETYAGVRPLYDDGESMAQKVTRDYVFELDAHDGAAPILSVFGGKITTFRKLSEHAMARLKPFFPRLGGDWTAAAHLPGGDIDDADFEAFLAELRARFPFLTPPLARHYGRLYGTRTADLVGNAESIADLGAQFGPDFYEREAAYLIENEWAEKADDILERRTKHGLQMTGDERSAFAAWMANREAKKAGAA